MAGLEDATEKDLEAVLLEDLRELYTMVARGGAAATEQTRSVLRAWLAIWPGAGWPEGVEAPYPVRPVNLSGEWYGETLTTCTADYGTALRVIVLARRRVWAADHCVVWIHARGKRMTQRCSDSRPCELHAQALVDVEAEAELA